jgi:hypothetical protein
MRRAPSVRGRKARVTQHAKLLRYRRLSNGELALDHGNDVAGAN